jgi:hypothetical protein
MVCVGAVAAVAQNCPLPPALQPLPPGIDIFSDKQEADLGDAMAEQIAPRLRMIENDILTVYLRSLGNRLVQHLPPTNLNFRFYLIDLPEPNAFSIAGGRVYVSRRLIAMTRSEDELAGIIAHELGHIVTHQTGIYMTRRFREVLGVTEVGDRVDIFEKYHRYLENFQRKPTHDSREPERSQILRFPSGERLNQLRLARGLTLRAVTQGDYLLVRPLKDHPLGLLDLTTGQLPISFERSAADIYDGVLVNERLDGEVALYPSGKKEPSAMITLPQARLGRLCAAAVSSDLEWIAISNRSRGALWNVASNVPTQHMRGFQGAWFSQNGVLYADFPKFQEEPRTIGLVTPMGSATSETYKVGDIVARQRGGFLVVTTPKGKYPGSNCDVEVRDITTNKPVWSRHFGHEVPSLTLNSAAGTLLLGWSLAEPGGLDELQNFADVKSQANKEDYLYEVVDLHKGSPSGKILVKTNKRSIHLEGGSSDGDWLVVTAAGNQILAFSMAGGLEKGHFFGTAPVVLASAGLLAVEKDAKELDLYDLESRGLRRRYVFSDPIAIKRMSDDGKRLLVLTASQTAYLLDTTVRN